MDDACFQRIAKALSEGRRLRILEKLKGGGEMHCGALVEALGGAQPTVSHHLKELTAANLLIVREERTYNYYRLNTATLALYAAELHERFVLPAEK